MYRLELKVEKNKFVENGGDIKPAQMSRSHVVGARIARPKSVTECPMGTPYGL